MLDLKNNIRRGASALAFITAMTGSAHAQEVSTPAAAAAASTDNEEIVVTGSRIRRDPLSGPSPVIIVDQQSISRTGLSAVADVLQRPQRQRRPQQQGQQ